MKNLYVIDDLNLVFRMFYGMPQMSHGTKKTNVVYGYLKTVKTLIEHGKASTGECPDIIVATDVKGKGSRLETFSEYKANRTKEMPDDCKSQLADLREVLQILKIPRIGFEGFEADDVIGTIAKTKTSDYEKIYIISSDKDLCQLVTENVHVMDALKKTVWHEGNVHEKFGIPKERIVDYLSLVGDSSDNIPGIKGIGEKTAVKLISDFGSLEDILEKANEDAVKEKKLSKSVLEKLVSGKESGIMSKKLATLVTDLDFEFPESEFSETSFETEEFERFCLDLNMKSLVKKKE